MEEPIQEQVTNEVPEQVEIKDIIVQEDKLDTILIAVEALIKKVDVPPPPRTITSTTKRLIVSGIFLIGVIVASGWAFGDVTAANALIVISSITTGGFALLKL